MIEHPLFCMCEWNYKFKGTVGCAECFSTLQLKLECVVSKLTMEEGTREQSMMITS